MIRASSAEDSELCGYIGVLNRRHPRTYRNTLLGTAAHHQWSGDPRAAESLERLIPDERAEVATWRKPDDWTDPNGGGLLEYRLAHKEHTVGLSDTGCYMDATPAPDSPTGYVEAPGLLIPATVDMWWFSKAHPAGPTVYVGDIKTGEHAIARGARNLQFVAPALALADNLGADWYRTGIWYARDGRWEWADPVHVTSDLAVQDFQRCRRAAANPPVPVLGSHCGDCFQRAYCDAFVLPSSQAETALAPLTAADKLAALTPDEHIKLHLAIAGLSKLVDTAKDTHKAWFDANGPLKLPDGSTLGLSPRAGREYADLAQLKAENLTKYIKRSRPSQVLGLKKAPAPSK